jgi:polyisoprenoid-binding protein YceI
MPIHFDANDKARRSAPMTTPAPDAPDTAAMETTRWRIDPTRSTIAFDVKMLWRTLTVKGRFDRYEGTLDLSADPAIALTIDAASLDTKNAKRDEHLRSPDFFGVEIHPYVRYVSEAATLDGERLVARGTLHARGATLPLGIEATLRRAGDELELEAVTAVDYRRIGMTWGTLWTKLGVLRTPGRLVVNGRLIRDLGA